MNVDQFEFSERTCPDDGPVRLLTVARLVEKKGVECGIRAVADSNYDATELRYDIVGDGPLRFELELLADRLDCSDVVTFHGQATRVEVVAFFERCHLFVLPSVTASDGDMEGQGLVLQEAQACGVPVLSTLHNGIPDGVLDGETGRLVPEADIGELAGAIGEMIECCDAWPAMGRAARDCVVENYDIDRLNDRLVDLYQNLQGPDG